MPEHKFVIYNKDGEVIRQWYKSAHEADALETILIFLDVDYERSYNNELEYSTLV